MILLLIFAFLAGLVTILSPCILPVLPIVLTGSIGNGKKRPIGIVIGFIGSFTFFTLTLSYIVKLTGLPADGLRSIAIFVIALFGLSMIMPKFQIIMERLFSKLAGILPKKTGDTEFIGGVFVGLSLGLLWSPCVGPILASVITLAATSTINFASILITLAYATGTAIPMLGITYGGRELLNRVPWLLASTQKIQKIFGVIMIATAIGIFFNIDRTFQSFILEKFPNYGTGLTKFEDAAVIKNSLKSVSSQQDAPDFIPGGEWINSTPLHIKDLRGKVVLVDFWTYTCINCIRTLPYIKAWNEKYKDKGLVIIGVHTPEFAFEKELRNVQKAVQDFAITYPVMQDNDFATWQAYDNHYWPAKYLIDKNGKIRNTHFGEGNYDETEIIIQTLLKETGVNFSEKPKNSEYQIHANSPESYLGYDRIQYLSSPEKISPNVPTQFTAPANLSLNTFAFNGLWTIGNERAMPHKNATLSFHFDAGTVYLVMRPKMENLTSQVNIFVDGIFKDTITVDADRLYELLKLDTPGEHIIKLQYLDDNAEAFAFTFG